MYPNSLGFLLTLALELVQRGRCSHFYDDDETNGGTPDRLSMVPYRPVFNPRELSRLENEQKIAVELLRGYDGTVRPGNQFFGQSIPNIINVTVEILSLSSFDDVTMEFTAQLRFQQEWMDERLKFAPEKGIAEGDFINLANDQPLWIPDTFFQNEQDGHIHLVDQPNQFVKVRTDGLVRYNKRLTMSFSCPMNLMLFPHDNQTCYIEFASYAYTTADIVFMWSPVAVHMNQNVSDSLPKFSIQQVSNRSCASKTDTGEYSCLQIRLILQREFSYFLLQLYIPSCMLVFVACLSFWIDWRSAPSRVPLTIVTLLTITTQAHGINANLPPVSYTKAIDIWIGACVVFIFGSLIEYAIVNYIGSNEEKRKAKNRGTGIPGGGIGVEDGERFGGSGFPMGMSSSSAMNNNGAAAPPFTNDCFNQNRHSGTFSHFWHKLGFMPNSVGSFPANNGQHRTTMVTSGYGFRSRSQNYMNDSSPLNDYMELSAAGDNLNQPNQMIMLSRPQTTTNNYESYLRAKTASTGLRRRIVDKLRNNRDYNKRDGQEEEGGGDCFDAAEYVQYRRTQCLLANSQRSARGTNWSHGSSDRSSGSRAEKIDMLSRILFPLGFVGFNIVYWSLYLPKNSNAE